MNSNDETDVGTKIMEGPSLADTIVKAAVAINSHPLLLLFWLVTSSAIVLFNRLTLPLALKAPLYVGSGILALLLASGVMGSMELIISKRGWILAAVWVCAKLYFPRFLLLGLLIATVALVIYVPTYVILENVGEPYYPSKEVTAATIIGLLVFAFYLTFTGSSIVIDNLLPLEAIERSFRIVIANRTKLLYLWLIYMGPLAAVELIFNMVLEVEWKGKLLQNVILSYIFLLMLMSVMYFNYTVKNQAEYEE